MAQRDRQKLRMVEGDMADAETILQSVKPKGEGTRLEKWLATEPDISVLFWDVMEKAKDRGVPFAAAFDAFLKHFPEAPKLNVQSVKRVVDARLTNR